MSKANQRDACDRAASRFDPDRRKLLLGGLGLLATSAVPFSDAWGQVRAVLAAAPIPAGVHPLIADIQKRTFRFFWETAHPQTGLVLDRYPGSSPASVAAVGFALTAYPIGAERGYVTRGEARERVLRTLRFLESAPQGPDATGMAGYRGFFYHYLDPATGLRQGKSELSTVDTALLLGGILFCQEYFDRDDAGEAEIRRLADTLYRRVDWRWVQPRPPAIAHGWDPEHGFLDWDWRGYNEAMIVYLLALGAPEHAVDANAWDAWTSTYDGCWRADYGLPHLAFGPMFGHQYCQTWVDFRGLQDAYLRARGIDYFESNRRAVYSQRAYAIANPHGWKDYGGDVWGVTASDGPANVTCVYNGKERTFRAYSARGVGGPGDYDDGTLAPTALVASIAVAPEIVLPAVEEMTRRFGAHLYATYGYLDAFNPSFDFNVPLTLGRCIPGFGWVASDYLGIDQGPIVAMIENYRSGLVWRTMQKSPYLRQGLERAGFTGGWLGGESSNESLRL
jgi:hypothetical protein